MVPSARDCMSAALYDALQAEYCPHGASNGYLRLQVWQPQAGVTAANHSDITALAATSSVTEPKFLGSPLHQFFVAAFTGTLEPGCAAVAVNLSDST